MEAIEICEELSGKKLNYSYDQTNRIGDHIWYISDVRKFQSHYPELNFQYNLNDIMQQMFQALSTRL